MEYDWLKGIYEYVHYFAIGAGLIWAYKTIIKVISDSKDRKRIFSWIDEGSWWETYSSLLSSLNKTLDIGFGERLISFVSFKNAFRLAWVYPWIFIFVFSLNDINNVEAYKKFFSVIFSLAISIPLAIKLRRTLFTIKESVPLGRFTKFMAFDAVFFPIFGILAIAVIVALITVIVTLVFDPSAGVLAGAVSLVVLSSSLLLVAFLIPIVLSVFYGAYLGDLMAALTAYSHSDPNFAKSIGIGAAFFIAIFLWVLPFINGLFDWFSWIASRYLIKRLKSDAEKHQAYACITHILVDVVIGIVLLLSISIVLAFFSNFPFSDITWDEYSIEPFKETSLSLTLMMLSTLLPTFLHLVMAVLALSSLTIPGKAIALSMLKKEEPSLLEKNVSAAWLFSSILFSVFVVIFSVSMILLLLENLYHFNFMTWVYEIGGKVAYIQ